MDSVLIVVLNWNGIADTKQCVESLRAQTYSNFEIMIVDNGSTEPGTDMALKELEASEDKLRVIRNQKNTGFAGGVNTGIRYAIDAGFEYVALLNPDATADPNWLKNLVATSKKQGSALTTSLLLHEDGKTVDSTGDWYTTWGLPFPRGRNEAASKAPDSGAVFGGSGGATLYTTSLFKQIGLFDETFFAYYEDVDISFRSQLAGYTAYFERSAVAYHKRGASSSKIPGFTVTQTMKNLPLVYIRNVPTKLLLSIGVRFWLAYTLILGHAVLSRNASAAVKGWLQGVWLFWSHGLASRRNIQRNSKISADDLTKLLWHDLPPDQTGLRKLFGKYQR
jgi:GT2 family glycosyltransferase